RPPWACGAVLIDHSIAPTTKGVMMAFSRRQFLAGLAACPACAAATGVARAEDAHWSYAGSHDWGAVGAFRACSIGGEQSPVNLTGAVRAEIEPPGVLWRGEDGRSSCTARL